MEYSQGNPDVPVIVPDAYQVAIELTDMIMPNKNVMEANRTGLARDRVTLNSNTAGKANKSKTNEKKKDSDPTQGAEKYMRGLEPETPPAPPPRLPPKAEVWEGPPQLEPRLEPVRPVVPNPEPNPSILNPPIQFGGRPFV
ncbi:MAG: hypothetical protein EBW87_04000 [Burkholderiaceae bacterium]|nr:hypothetical protein [Burkholderiaceae bacterium]